MKGKKARRGQESSYATLQSPQVYVAVSQVTRVVISNLSRRLKNAQLPVQLVTSSMLPSPLLGASFPRAHHIYWRLPQPQIHGGFVLRDINYTASYKV